MTIKTNEKQHQKTKLAKHINRNGWILAIFAFLSTVTIAITHHFTKDRIALAVEQNMIQQLSEIVPANFYDNEVYKDCVKTKSLTLLGSEDFQKAYRLRQQNQDVGLLLTAVAPDGYSGPIEFSLLVSRDGKIIGVNIISHRETPGLGDKIERRKSDWLDQFIGLSLQVDDNHWRVKKDGGQIDALTGATITPRALVKATHKTLLFYQQHQQQLFSEASNCGKTHGQ